jgi:hypothetical protein
MEIKQRQERIGSLVADVVRRDAHAGDEFSMTVGNRLYSGKGAREAAAAALVQTVLAARNDPKLQVRGVFRGFAILSRGRAGAVVFGDDERLPELLVGGSNFYNAQLNAENPVGTMQSIEHTIRALDKNMLDEKERQASCEKMLADYQQQLGKVFEHEARLKEPLAKQAELNAALDLDKGERQIAPPAEINGESGSDDPAQEKTPDAAAPRPCYEARGAVNTTRRMMMTARMMRQ